MCLNMVAAQCSSFQQHKRTKLFTFKNLQAQNWADEVHRNFALFTQFFTAISDYLKRFKCT